MDGKKGLGRALRRAIGVPVVRKPDDHSVPSERESVLMNHTRLRLLEALCNRPCSHVRSLARQLGIAPPSVIWHLDKLAQKGIVCSRDIGNRRFYYPAEMLDEEDILLLSFLSHAVRFAVVRTVAEEPGITQGDLVLATGANSHTLRALAEREIITVTKDGRNRRYYLAPSLRRKKDAMDRRARRFCQLLVIRLEDEGLSPEITGSGRDPTELTVKAGTTLETLRFSRNPYDFAVRR